MKVEMGESLIYSWLRHIKNCQVVQNNWKPSPQWALLHSDELERLWEVLRVGFEERFGYKIFKKTSSFAQFLRQAECDSLGVCHREGAAQYYAVDVAFHEEGLSYGSREETVAKIAAKCIRNAFCLYGYMNAEEGEIIFAAPKITPAVLGDAARCIDYLNQVFQAEGFRFTVRVLCNDAFRTEVLDAVLGIKKSVSDTSELFLRAYQLVSMFEGKSDA